MFLIRGLWKFSLYPAPGRLLTRITTIKLGDLICLAPIRVGNAAVRHDNVRCPITGTQKAERTSTDASRLWRVTWLVPSERNGPLVACED
jgi:hypothetical protein